MSGVHDAAMKHIRQPTQMSCAQACAAMVLNRPLNLVLKELPHTESGTTYKAFIQYIKTQGAKCDNNFISLRGKPLPRKAVLRVTWDDGKTHLICKDEDGAILDPMVPGVWVRHTVEGVNAIYANKKGRVTSFVEIYE